ncbi:FAD-dependent oxidoreductase [Saccharopolyspora spinosporotrichia]
MTVVVVGAGPAGIAAAGAAARAGVRVVLVDAAARPGGQYHRQNSLSPEGEFGLPEGVEHLADSSVWAVEPIDGGHRVHVRTGRADGPGRRGRRVDTPALVLATGAYDRALPFPGWTLPGVYTAGAAQALVKGQGSRSATGCCWPEPARSCCPLRSPCSMPEPEFSACSRRDGRSPGGCATREGCSPAGAS